MRNARDINYVWKGHLKVGQNLLGATEFSNESMANIDGIGK